ncbi:MAG TPA: hypothetical protein VGD71_13980 [Kribbella sp.]
MKTIRGVVLVGVVVVGLVAASCSKSGGDSNSGGGTAGARLSDVATRFQADVRKLSDDLLGNNSVPGTKLAVTSDGTSDIACDPGRAKRVYDASFPMLDRADGTGMLFAMKVNSYATDYTITKSPDQASDTPAAELKRKDKPFTVTVKVDRSATVKMAIHAETDCLNAP